MVRRYGRSLPLFLALALLTLSLSTAAATSELAGFEQFEFYRRTQEAYAVAVTSKEDRTAAS
jgi:L-fucose mutarotase/ribose pyranase (RbsD/FucU family)